MSFRNACGKVVFTSAKKAKQRAASINKKNQKRGFRGKLRHYDCPDCGYYHLTSESKSKYLKNVEKMKDLSKIDTGDFPMSYELFKDQFTELVSYSLDSGEWEHTCNDYYTEYKKNYYPNLSIDEWVFFYFAAHKKDTHVVWIKEKQEEHSNVENRKRSIISLEKERFAWAVKTFPMATAESSIIKMQKEGDEIISDIRAGLRRPEEYADALMCLFDSAGRHGITPSEIFDAFEEKLKVNKKRKWVLNPDNTYSHIK